MKSGGLHPRPDQISLLTQGISLPLPEVPREYLDIILEAIAEAYEDVKATHPSLIASEQEVEITTAVRNKLIRMLSSQSLFTSVVQYIARGEEHLSFNGENIEKRPDFSFKLTIGNRTFPLLAEAKVVKFVQSNSVSLYCKKGILRFVKGEYSWWDKDAIMIAYVIGGRTIQKDLTPFLMKDMSKKKPAYSTGSLPTITNIGVQSLPRSEHFRNFHYNPGTLGGGQPGTVSLWHLWLC